MKCSKCGKKNIVRANYCISCKNEFTEEEQEKAYKKTIWGKLEKIEEWYNHLTLATITDHIAFKILMLLLVLGAGLYYYFTRGIDTKILNSEAYEVYYSKEAGEYYLVVDDNAKEIKLGLYIPNRVLKLDIEHYKKDGELIDTKTYKEEDDLILSTYDEDYYNIKSTYDSKEDNIKMFIYRRKNINIEK